MPNVSQDLRRTVEAPLPSPLSARALSNRVFSVVLAPDEDVEWIYTHTQDGVSYVTGYTIVKKETH